MTLLQHMQLLSPTILTHRWSPGLARGEQGEKGAQDRFGGVAVDNGLDGEGGLGALVSCPYDLSAVTGEEKGVWL